VKTIVLNFDDGWLSHYEKVRPILLDFGFGATFFITWEYLVRSPFMGPKHVQALHNEGFEIGNHLIHHLPMTGMADLEWQIMECERQLVRFGVDKPVSLAYPGFHYNDQIMNVVHRCGYWFGRAGLGRHIPETEYEEGGAGRDYRIMEDDCMDVVCKGIFGAKYGYDEFTRDVETVSEEEGCYGVFVFHNFVNGGDNPIHVPFSVFERSMEHLKEQDHRVIALRDILRQNPVPQTGPQ